MKEDGFITRERLGKDYWQDIRWQQVEKLRKENKITESNYLVQAIRSSWGIE